MEQNDFPGNIKRSVVRRFNLRHDQAEEEEVIDSITRNSDFIGANLWTLIFAILVASIGLNMNSTAVIIGAMLISPLMGPIMGIGLGIGTNDFGLVKKGLRNLIIATVISIVTSAIYFWITPIDTAQSELLARTTPSVWDVFIAFFGGLAGVVAATRKEKSNAIPGVAIATALMPPLCTAGYGLATGQFYYFLGALYLYCINSIFICISTFLIIRLMKFKKKSFEDQNHGKRVSRNILLLTLITVLPSIYLTYGIVNKSLFENASKQFVTEQFRFDNTQVVSKTFRYDKETPEIDLVLIGDELSDQTIDSIRTNMRNYDLQDAKLIIRQGLSAEREIDFSQIKASILKDVFAKDSMRIHRQAKAVDQFPTIYPELKALYPSIISYSADKVVQFRSGGADTLTVVVADFPKTMRTAEQLQLQRWLIKRLKVDTLKLVVSP